MEYLLKIGKKKAYLKNVRYILGLCKKTVKTAMGLITTLKKVPMALIPILSQYWIAKHEHSSLIYCLIDYLLKMLTACKKVS